MLPQSAALKVLSGDTARVRSETGQDGRQSADLFVCKVEGRVASNGNRHKARKGAFVLDARKKPLMPCSSKRARLLLAKGRARVHKLYPFTIRLVDRKLEDCAVQPVIVKLDPGSKKTGVTVVRDDDGKQSVLMLAEIEHRGAQISERLKARSSMRRRRRVNLRYRPARFANRTKPEGWLAPSLQHRVDNITSWVARLRALVPVRGIAMELVRFDMQIMENAEISGVEYQRGTLAGMESREYLLAKFNRKCAYCDAEGIPLQIEHIHPTSRGGSNRINNLTLACRPCNQAKAALPIEVFLSEKPELLAKIQAQVKCPLKDAAAVNATRWALFNKLKTSGLPVQTGSGGRTKWNRTRLEVPKTHALDAACVGRMDALSGWDSPSLAIKATGRGRYGRTLLDSFGFPRAYLMQMKLVHGFKTGDMVRASAPKGKHTGSFTGRLAVRAHGSFSVSTREGTKSASWKNCRVIHRGDGYSYVYNQQPAAHQNR